MGGEDLDDDFDFDISSTGNQSDDEAGVTEKGLSSKKRSHESAEEQEEQDKVGIETDEKTKKKKKKKKNTDSQNDGDMTTVSLEELVNTFDALFRKELALKFIPAELNMIPKLKVSQLFELPPTLKAAKGKLQLEHLPSFIKACVEIGAGVGGSRSSSNTHSKSSLKSNSKSKQSSTTLALPLPPPGEPQVIVICASALRCCAMVPCLRKSSLMIGKKGDHVAKLFAKHQKVPEHVNELKSQSCRVVVGTPNRLHRLFDEKALKLDQCHLILLDTSERDSKNYSLLTLPGVVNDLMLLFKEHLVAAKGDNKTVKFAFL